MVEKEKEVKETVVVEKVITPELPSKYKEAPALAKLVADGKLPKIEAQAATSASATLTVISSSISVTLTSPVNGATYTEPANVQLTANVASTAAIARVQFFDGTSLLGTDTASPYTMVAQNLGSGTHVFTAQATDANGRSATSAPVQVTVTSSNGRHASSVNSHDH